MRVVLITPEEAAPRDPGRMTADAIFWHGIAAALAGDHDVEIRPLPTGGDRSSRPAQILDGPDLVLVDGGLPAEQVAALAAQRPRGADQLLLLRDPRRRALDAGPSADPDLGGYDGVLTGGDSVRRAHAEAGWGDRAVLWPHAVNTDVLHPQPAPGERRDLVWIGAWGGGERDRDLSTFLLDPVRRLRLNGTVYGRRVSPRTRMRLRWAGLRPAGSLPADELPAALAAHRLTVHVPREVGSAPAPRVFDALACGIPLACAPGEDADGMLTPGEDYLLARDGDEMRDVLSELLSDADLAAGLAAHGRETVLARHSCATRAQELLATAAGLRGGAATAG